MSKRGENEKIEAVEVVKKTAKKGLKKTLKTAAACGAAVALLVSLVIPSGIDAIQNASSSPGDKLMSPPPVVMELDDGGDAVTEESQDEEQEEKKMGFFKRLKLALYGFLAGIGGFFATKVPWKKVFCKRNLIIYAILIILALIIRFFGPQIWEWVSPVFTTDN